jgi:hypothetical protein
MGVGEMTEQDDNDAVELKFTIVKDMCRKAKQMIERNPLRREPERLALLKDWGEAITRYGSGTTLENVQKYGERALNFLYFQNKEFTVNEWRDRVRIEAESNRSRFHTESAASKYQGHPLDTQYNEYLKTIVFRPDMAGREKVALCRKWCRDNSRPIPTDEELMLAQWEKNTELPKYKKGSLGSGLSETMSVL